MAIVRVRWHADQAMQATIERAVAAAANGLGHVIRLSSDDVIVAMSQGHLAAAGLTPAPQQRTTRRTDIEVTEIVHSLQLREVLGLTSPNEVADRSPVELSFTKPPRTPRVATRLDLISLRLRDD